MATKKTKTRKVKKAATVPKAQPAALRKPVPAKVTAEAAPAAEEAAPVVRKRRAKPGPRPAPKPTAMGNVTPLLLKPKKAEALKAKE